MFFSFTFFYFWNRQRIAFFDTFISFLFFFLFLWFGQRVDMHYPQFFILFLSFQFFFLLARSSVAERPGLACICVVKTHICIHKQRMEKKVSKTQQQNAYAQWVLKMFYTPECTYEKYPQGMCGLRNVHICIFLTFLGQ